jgi:hypothetical protein
MGASRKLVVITCAPAVSRSRSPTTRLSVSPLKNTDAQIQLARVGFVPTTDSRSIKAGGNSRPGSGTDFFFKLKACF